MENRPEMEEEEAAVFTGHGSEMLLQAWAIFSLDLSSCLSRHAQPDGSHRINVNPSWDYLGGYHLSIINCDSFKGYPPNESDEVT